MFIILQIRGTLKNWARFWCLVKPGALIIYRNDKVDNYLLYLLTVEVDLEQA